MIFLEKHGEFYDFNSIMVRLKVVVATFGLLKTLFQFHNGAIKSFSCLCYNQPDGKFQFHNGAIKSNANHLPE